MTNPTILASAQITRSTHDVVTVELVAPADMPTKVRVVWPLQPSLIDPKDFPDVAGDVARLFARAHVVLAALKATRRRHR
jgi:hypothetical protein